MKAEVPFTQLKSVHTSKEVNRFANKVLSYLRTMCLFLPEVDHITVVISPPTDMENAKITLQINKIEVTLDVFQGESAYATAVILLESILEATSEEV